MYTNIVSYNFFHDFMCRLDSCQIYAATGINVGTDVLLVSSRNAQRGSP